MLLEDKTVIQNIKKSCWNSFIASFLLIIFAIVLLINPDNFMNIAINVFGYGAIFMGVINLVIYFRIPKEQRILSKNFQTGLLLFMFGIISFVETNMLKEIVTLLIGGYLIFRNVERANTALNIKNYTKKMWVYLLLISFINIILGFLIVINPFTTLDKVNTLIASLLITAEGLLIIENIIIIVGLRSYEKEDHQ